MLFFYGCCKDWAARCISSTDFLYKLSWIQMWKISNSLSVLELSGFCCVFSSIFSLFQKGIISYLSWVCQENSSFGWKIISSVNVFLPVIKEWESSVFPGEGWFIFFLIYTEWIRSIDRAYEYMIKCEEYTKYWMCRKETFVLWLLPWNA